MSEPNTSIGCFRLFVIYSDGADGSVLFDNWILPID